VGGSVHAGVAADVTPCFFMLSNGWDVRYFDSDEQAIAAVTPTTNRIERLQHGTLIWARGLGRPGQ
jgi:hypothetical protein